MVARARRNNEDFETYRKNLVLENKAERQRFKTNGHGQGAKSNRVMRKLAAMKAALDLKIEKLKNKKQEIE